MELSNMKVFKKRLLKGLLRERVAGTNGSLAAQLVTHLTDICRYHLPAKPLNNLFDSNLMVC